MEALKALWGFISLAIFIWSVYFIVKIAQHVDAWPF